MVILITLTNILEENKTSFLHTHYADKSDKNIWLNEEYLETTKYGYIG